MMSGASRLRFCGKIFGTLKDYWVAAGELLPGEEFPNDINLEKRG